jgi:hypothetical protein
LLIQTQNCILSFGILRNSLKSSSEKFSNFLEKLSKFLEKKCQKNSKSVCVQAGELKFCMNMLYYECFKAWFSDFEVLDICGGCLENIPISLVCNMWKVDTRPTSASDFFVQKHITSLFSTGMTY